MMDGKIAIWAQAQRLAASGENVMRPMSILGSALLLALPAQAGEALKKLHSSRGGAVIEYERAVAGSEEFARLPRGASAPTVAVAPASGTPEEEGRTVAGAYADALRAVFPDVRLVAAGDRPASGYLAEVGVSSGSEVVEVTEQVYGTRQTGVSCKAQGTSVECTDRGGAPISLGTRPAQQTERQVAVTIRFYRQAADTGARAIVFEDAYSIRYPVGACRYDGAAAATVAAALAGNALSPEPLHIRFHSDPRLLRCDRQ